MESLTRNNLHVSLRWIHAVKVLFMLFLVSTILDLQQPCVLVMALSMQQESSSSSWQPLPHLDRRHVLRNAAFVSAGVGTSGTIQGGGSRRAYANNNSQQQQQQQQLRMVGRDGEVNEVVSAGIKKQERSILSIDSNFGIPVWPTWGGGRVVPVSLGNSMQDPYLLLAHHKHWFDPRDPLRGPFKAFGKALRLPYIDVEGFSMHPHRGIDILTYILDGSDGFQHKDSLGGSRIYRGGSAQFMRTGSGVLHEEFWETKNDKRTNIELYQIWMNLPSKQKFDPPAIQYIGDETDHPWIEQKISSTSNNDNSNNVFVRDIGATLDTAAKSSQKQDESNIDETSGAVVQDRPRIGILHTTLEPGTEWIASASSDHSAVLYVREGTATLSSRVLVKDDDSNNYYYSENDEKPTIVKALQSVTFLNDGDSITIQNTNKKDPLDVLVLTGIPLKEPVAMGGPVVMNTQQEISDAYRQLQDGTFLDRDVALRQQARTNALQGSYASNNWESDII